MASAMISPGTGGLGGYPGLGMPGFGAAGMPGFGGAGMPAFGGAAGMPGFGAAGTTLSPFLGNNLGLGANWAGPTAPSFWWGAPLGWSDLDLYDYNNNFVLDDNEIADIVADNIHLDPFIPLSDERNITIEVRNGVVTLSGTVRTPRTKPLAYADAFWSPGVVDVVDNLKVEPVRRRSTQQQQSASGQQREQQSQQAQQQQEGGSRRTMGR